MDMTAYRRNVNRNTPEAPSLTRIDVNRIDVNRMHFTTLPAERVADVTAALDAQRANRRAATDPIDRDVAERNVVDLEATLERAEVNLKAHLALTTRLEAERKAERDAADKATLDAQVDQLRVNYLSQPGATESDFEKALPRLLERQREDAALSAASVFDQQVAEARRRIGSML